MADNNTQNPEQGAASGATAGQQDAALFDDLTVLSRGDGLGETRRTEDMGAVPERVDNTGNENVQSDLAGSESREGAEVVTVGAGGGDVLLGSQEQSGGLTIDEIETSSAGRQAGVPFVDSTPPAAEAQLAQVDSVAAAEPERTVEE